jgi:hypothetical protein
MRNRLVPILGALFMAALLLWTAASATAQTSSSTGKTSNLPRTPDGYPDLQGIYDLATLTPVERAAGTALVITKEEAANRRLREHSSERLGIRRSEATGWRHPKAAMDRLELPATWAVTTRVGSIRARPTRS